MIYLRNVWYVAAWGQEIEPGKILARTILDELIALFRRKDGSVAAIQDRCPHRFAPLSAGVLKDDHIACRYHGLGFDGEGSCVVNPHGPLLRNARVRSYPIHEVHRAVWIWMGDPERADPALIPDLSYLANAPETAFSAGQLPSGPGNYEIFVDNILDLSHADYLHPDTFGGGNLTKAKQEVVETEECLQVTWYSRDTPPSPLAARLLETVPERTDTFNRVQWYAPSVMRLTSGVMPAGADESVAVGSSNAHIMTPETGRTTHYFFAATRNHQIHNAELNERIASTRQKIFATEDKPMIELVDQRMGDQDFWSLRPLLFSIDTASVRARRRLQALIKAEQERESALAATAAQ